MTLRRKMTIQLSAMLLGVLLVSGAALWGLNGLHQDYGVALEGYQRLRQVYEASSHLRLAQKLLALHSTEPAQPASLQMARDEMRAAVTSFEQVPAGAAAWDPHADEAVRSALSSLRARVVNPTAGGADAESIQSDRDAISDVLSKIPALASVIRTATETSQAAAQHRRSTTIGAVAGLSAAVVAAMIVLGMLQYGGVVRPLRRLSEGVRTIAAGQFHGRVDPRGGDEFASLAGDFNRMAGELDGFYHELERKVADKSRELIRSERLASVGYLAAGVAHEINNPLGIISGYAEYSLAELRDRRTQTADPWTTKDASPPNGNTDGIEKSLQIICDEAFRCKEITGKLLSLARPGDDNRRAISLADMANHVASMVRGLQAYRDRRIVVAHDAATDVCISAVEAEIKQVLLNLTVNALEAVVPGDGEVRVTVRRDGDEVELCITDNGRGMSRQTVERVFEPFFTDKRGRGPDGQHGTGLGLSITHAIVVAHGGQISAHSDGLGKGSRFVARLPAAGVTGKLD